MTALTKTIIKSMKSIALEIGDTYGKRCLQRQFNAEVIKLVFIETLC